jgi:hypothetical protein
MSEKIVWLSPVPKSCDICKKPITGEFVDGRTVMGPWGCLCNKCHFTYGVGTGIGRGQRYKLINGEYVCVEGGSR